MVKNQPSVWDTWVQSLGWEDPLEEGMATHSSVLAWRIPMDRGARWATIHGVTKSRTWLKPLSTHTGKEYLNAGPVLRQILSLLCCPSWGIFVSTPGTRTLSSGWDPSGYPTLFRVDDIKLLQWQMSATMQSSLVLPPFFFHSQLFPWSFFFLL